MLATDEVARFISPPPDHGRGFERFIAWTHRERAAGHYICFGVVPHGMDTRDRDFPGPAAGAGFGTAEWGFAIGSAFWGTGASSTARRWSWTSRSTSSARTASRRARRSPTAAATARCARSAHSRRASCGNRSSERRVLTRPCGRFWTRTGGDRSRSRGSLAWASRNDRTPSELLALQAAEMPEADDSAFGIFLYLSKHRRPVDSVRGRPLRCQSMTLAAVFPPMPTPFADGEVDAKAVSANVARWIRAGLGGVVALGTNGEAALLDEDEVGPRARRRARGRASRGGCSSRGPAGNPRAPLSPRRGAPRRSAPTWCSSAHRPFFEAS